MNIIHEISVPENQPSLTSEFVLEVIMKASLKWTDNLKVLFETFQSIFFETIRNLLN